MFFIWEKQRKIQCHVVKNTLLQAAFLGDFAHWVVE